MKLKIEINAEYFNAIDALIEKGYEYKGENEDGKETFTKDGEAFIFEGMNHYNKFIYNITLKK